MLRPGPGRLQLQKLSERASLPPGSTRAEALKWPAVFLTCFFSYLPAKQRLSRTSTGFLAPLVAVQSPEATSGWQHPTELCQPASRWSPPKGPWTAPTSLRLRPQMAILPGLTQAVKVSGPGQSRRGCHTHTRPEASPARLTFSASWPRRRDVHEAGASLCEGPAQRRENATL